MDPRVGSKQNASLLRWSLWLAMDSFPTSQYAWVSMNQNSQCHLWNFAVPSLARWLFKKIKREIKNYFNWGNQRLSSVNISMENCETNHLYRAMGSSPQFPHASISLHRILRYHELDFVASFRWPHLNLNKYSINHTIFSFSNLLLFHTFSRWKNYLFLGNGIF